MRASELIEEQILSKCSERHFALYCSLLQWSAYFSGKLVRLSLIKRKLNNFHDTSVQYIWYFWRRNLSVEPNKKMTEQMIGSYHCFIHLFFQAWMRNFNMINGLRWYSSWMMLTKVIFGFVINSDCKNIKFITLEKVGHQMNNHKASYVVVSYLLEPKTTNHSDDWIWQDEWIVIW